MKSRYSLHTFLVLAVLLCFRIPALAAEVPDGFVVTQVATGMTSVTRMELLPDGRILVLEQGGKIRLINNGVLQSTPYLTLDVRSEEHTSELQSQSNLVCRLLLEKKKNKY